MITRKRKADKRKKMKKAPKVKKAPKPKKLAIQELLDEDAIPAIENHLGSSYLKGGKPVYIYSDGENTFFSKSKINKAAVKKYLKEKEVAEEESYA